MQKMSLLKIVVWPQKLQKYSFGSHEYEPTLLSVSQNYTQLNHRTFKNNLFVINSDKRWIRRYNEVCQCYFFSERYDKLVRFMCSFVLFLSSLKPQLRLVRSSGFLEFFNVRQNRGKCEQVMLLSWYHMNFLLEWST